MRETYVTEDLLNTLIALEIRGNENYTRLSAQSKDEKSRELFGILAMQELKHKAIYEGFKGSLTGTETADADYLAYVELLLEKQVPIIAKRIVPEDYQEGLQLAVELEKETIYFLHEVKGLLGQEQANQVEPLIAEERKHLQYLLELE